MASRFQEISFFDFSSWMFGIGFEAVDLENVFEYVWERKIVTRKYPDRFIVRIYSSISKNTNETRETGSDAIRVMLFDTVLDKPVKDWTVYRTKNAKSNVIARARDAWGYVIDSNHHCSCGSLMVQRSSRHGNFFGCTTYPTCKETR